jgi:hypothetical protein
MHGAPLERPNYFTGRLLGAADFTAEQSYFLDRLRRHNRLLHGYGVVCGLQVRCADPASAVITIDPGYAIDAWGDEIFVGETGYKGTLRDLCGHGLEPPAECFVALRYVARQAQPVPAMLGPGVSEAESIQYSRCQDSFEVGCLTALPESHLARLGRAGHRTGRRGSGEAAGCPPCPADRWVVLSRVEWAGARVCVHNDCRLAIGLATSLRGPSVPVG